MYAHVLIPCLTVRECTSDDDCVTCYRYRELADPSTPIFACLMQAATFQFRQINIFTDFQSSSTDT